MNKTADTAAQLIQRSSAEQRTLCAQCSSRETEFVQALLSRGEIVSDDGEGGVVVAAEDWAVALHIGDEWRAKHGGG